MKPLHLVPDDVNVPFLKFRKIFYIVSLVMVLASVGLFVTKGLNFGIDFRGGILLEIKTDGPADIGALRDNLGSLGLGDVSIQEFGEPDDVLIQLQRQDGDEKAQMAALATVTEALGDNVTIRRSELVGPKVGDELKEAGVYSVAISLLLIMVYIWFRFEWQFAVASVVALLHDVLITIGFFVITGVQFDLATLAAVLTVAGYSINDTVVVFDRIREYLRKFRKMEIPDLLDLSINSTLSRTTMTSFTTLLALIALFVFGGEAIRGFTMALIFGIVIGTYSSICVASPLLMVLRLNRKIPEGEETQKAGA
ncbi:preprotein translocase subunit SecF [Thalassospira sp. MBR-102]|jgi:preprotein translocase subunit SecF|uniref:Protein-export membrane protein SecF n=3 Tax=Thalassospira TaxID=168934 RepID=A0ABR5XX95_9PROT|nr:MULTISPECIES: protein translocase subunit SecF [Thalassospira]MBR9778927.1 protein translocase subunit SecF [Rhodospirillales bacterium]AJD52026.1 preprotein translocase subunit SecF [Thalassospira xiamenensis M-5 = DSM 17429]KEO50619.1 preprotein translocase subunit SecF [Thalassospira permensis NBRC 106175]KZC97067.1 preprotein translocase subunit SecF [Thalassospira xiamenensis]KZD08062.1 preprotein translocase subunit SecF [Thalassospira xiamenensis]|tara:strand:- start:1517 stop:2446 length:930 start_codon:yes stop_codon:yes gene_type:complete|eukprot:TRINITY_DN1569_c0_g4_i1.p1 TRINITY_DN1569_c0_g4~~TRINITY_DN1569_c0_g4_i1.p1  ORF type:complete len:310 (+),score=68.83 TRINITY_DN1569_c0_g4_i1:330-1259(+)